MRWNTFQSGDFQEIDRFVYIQHKFRGWYLNPVLHVSICWTSRTHKTPVSKPGPTTPFSNQIDAAE